MSQSFAPPGESAEDLWRERSNFVGLNLESVAYGVHLCVFFSTLYCIVRTPPGSKRVGWPFVTLICLLFILGTFQMAGIKFFQMMWIDQRNFPGGPNAWLLENFDNPINTFGDAAYVISNILADGSLIYRLFVVWNGNLYITIVPLLTYLATIALAIITLFQSAQPNASLWSRITVQFVVPYWSLSVSLNVLLTLIISFRLLHMRRSVAVVLGPEHSKVYTSVVSMIIESAALFSGTGLFFIICYARNSNIQNLVLPILDQVVCIAPELIILRVAQGRAWTRDTSRQIASSVVMRRSGHPAVTWSKEETSANPSSGATYVRGPSSFNENKSNSTFEHLSVKVDTDMIAIAA